MDLDSYISGFVDGEGCFCVSFQPSKRHRFGWEVRPSFSVSQNADRAELLYIIQEKWGCGFNRPDRSDRTLKFEMIVRLAMEMNPSGKRKYIGSDILKSLRSGERIVYATGNCGSP